MFAESIGNTAKLFFAVSCQSAEEFAEGHCCDSRALLNLAIMGEPAHNGVHYFLKEEFSNFYAIELIQNIVFPQSILEEINALKHWADVRDIGQIF